MGFGSLFGSKKTTVPASGFYALPQEYQDLYKGLLGSANDIFLPGGELNVDMFTPLGVTDDEEYAFDLIREGLTPTPESLGKDISMLMNPFDDYVISDIQREAQGENSILNQALSKTGQMGSNRGILGASDVEQRRLDRIGQFRQGQYNVALDTALGRLTDLKSQDIGNRLGIGTFDRNLDSQTKQAPFTALNAGTGSLTAFPTQFGNFGSPETTVKTGGGLGGILGGISGIAKAGGGIASALGYGGTGSTLSSIGTALGFFSDPRLKENIVPAGREAGLNLYKFNYIGDDTTYVGVMADEVEKVMPEAVGEYQGYKTVNYDMLGIERKVV